MAEYEFLIATIVAGLVASLACGLGALPLAFGSGALEKRIGLGYGAAGGLMFAASVYNLLLPALELGSGAALQPRNVVEVLLGFGVGAACLCWIQTRAGAQALASRWSSRLGGRVGALVFIAMALHSIPEGIAVGVGYASEEHLESARGLGETVAIAISIHNIPEGLAVALPMRAAGASVRACFLAAFLTSLPQPIAAVPASLLVWLFEPLMIPSLGFAAGAMIYLVIAELIPEGLESRGRHGVAWAFIIGFAAMVLVQMVL